jgi:hypothetical protein
LKHGSVRHQDNAGWAWVILVALVAFIYLWLYLWLAARPDSLLVLEDPPVASPTVAFHEPPQIQRHTNPTRNDDYPEKEQQPRRRRLKSQQAPTQLSADAYHEQLERWNLFPQLGRPSETGLPLMALLLLVVVVVVGYAVVWVNVLSIATIEFSASARGLWWAGAGPVLRWWKRIGAFLTTVVTQKRREFVQTAPKQVRTAATLFVLLHPVWHQPDMSSCGRKRQRSNNKRRIGSGKSKDGQSINTTPAAAESSGHGNTSQPESLRAARVEAKREKERQRKQVQRQRKAEEVMQALQRAMAAMAERCASPSGSKAAIRISVYPVNADIRIAFTAHG